MPSSLQQIEAALAHVQLPVAQRNGQGAGRAIEAAGLAKGEMVSCSFDIGSDMAKPAAASSLAQVEPPQFCKPLRRVVSQEPLQPVSMVVKQEPELSAPAVSTAFSSSTDAIADIAPLLNSPSQAVAVIVETVTTVDASGTDASIADKPDVLLEGEPSPSANSESDAESDAEFDSGADLETDSQDDPQDAVPAGVQPMQVRAIEEVDSPELPRAKMPEFKTHRNHSNPMLPLGLLQDIGKEVVSWQSQLKIVHDAIQSLYDEGPIVNAWLESVAGNAQAKAKVEAQDKANSEAINPAPELMMAGRYCVCGLDKAGQVWRKLCPPEQLPQVSMAIARHQKLRQLLSQKQSIDGRLQRLAQTLTVLRGRLRAY